MESKTIITDLTIEVELSTQNDSIALINEITSLITATDEQIMPVDTNIFDTSKAIFVKKEIPIVLLCNGEYMKNEYPDYNIKKWYISIEFTELERRKVSYPLLQELIQLLKHYQIPYKLTKVTFALDISLQGSFHSINVEKYNRSYPLEKGFVFIEDRHRQIVRQQIIDNRLRLLTTLENRSFCLDHLMIDEALHNVKFHIDNAEVLTLDFNFILGYLNKLFK